MLLDSYKYELLFAAPITYIGLEPPKLESAVGRVEEGIPLLDFHATVTLAAQLPRSFEEGSGIRDRGLDLHVPRHG